MLYLYSPDCKYHDKFLFQEVNIMYCFSMLRLLSSGLRWETFSSEKIGNLSEMNWIPRTVIFKCVHFCSGCCWCKTLFCEPPCSIISPFSITVFHLTYCMSFYCSPNTFKDVCQTRTCLYMKSMEHEHFVHFVLRHFIIKPTALVTKVLQNCKNSGYYKN